MFSVNYSHTVILNDDFREADFNYFKHLLREGVTKIEWTFSSFTIMKQVIGKLVRSSKRQLTLFNVEMRIKRTVRTGGGSGQGISITFS